MFENLDRNKMEAFVTHLFSNPNIKNEPILIGETLIINFITKNLASLKELLRTPQFFPEATAEETLQFLLVVLRDRVVNEISPFITNYINDNINFSFLNKLTGRPVDENTIKNKIITFTSQLLRHKDVRYNFNSVINIFKHGKLSLYMKDIFDRRQFIYNELTKVQKLNLPVEEYINYMKILLLLKNVVYIKIPIDTGEKTVKINLNDLKKIPKLENKFISLVMSVVNKELGDIFSESILRMAVKSNFSEEKTALEEASARFLYIMSHRFQDYRHYEKIERGAETPDKSWFAVSKKNANYYGFDKRMLDELYKVAADNNW